MPMKLKLAIVGILSLLLVPAAFAACQFEDVCADVTQAMPVGSQVRDGIPLKDESINVFLHSGELVGSIATEDGAVGAFACCAQTESTIDVSFDATSTFYELRDSENFVDLANDMVDEGRITIDGNSFFKDVKVFFAKIGLSIASIFS